jgi:hypothetical protein
MAACVSGQPPSHQDLDGKVPCCAMFSELNFVEARAGEELRVDVKRSAQIFGFPEGNSFVAPLALNKEAGAGGTLLVKSYLSGQWLPSATVFFPKFVFLDASHRPVRTAESVQVVQDYHYFKGSFFYTLLAVNPDEKFVVIYSDSTRRGDTLPYFNKAVGTVYVTPTPGVVHIPGQDATFMIPSVATGRLEILLVTP